MKKVLCFLLIIFCCIHSYAQIIYGSNNYIEYQIGTIPIIISAPHGGNITPASIPDRTCNNPTTVTDGNTLQLSKQIDSALYNLTGCHPHVIICNLKRTKIDCNRNLADGACGNTEAETAWTEFHHFIDTAQALSQNQFSGKAFYIDLHGHGHAIQQLELGYTLNTSQLNSTDSVLNTTAIINSSSIQNLVATNINGYTHAELLRGPYSFGTLISNAGFPSVPSQQTPSPGINPYFSGGYNTQNYTGNLPGNTVDGLQMECNSNVRSTYSNRKAFADSLALVFVNYLSIHQNINFSNCSPTSSLQSLNINAIGISPNPATDFIHLSNLEKANNYTVEIVNTLGETIIITANQNKIEISSLSTGVYFVKVKMENSFYVKKFIHLN